MATERAKEAFVGRSGATSSPRVHGLCQKRLQNATSKSRSFTMCGVIAHLFFFLHMQAAMFAICWTP